jgi:transposase-like protein
MIEMIGFDGTHTASRFKMNLLIAGGVNANGKTLPLAWALVPIENGSWWRWFLKHLKKAFKLTTVSAFVFMSDREKGIPSAEEEIFPEASPSYCCQHIADNVQQ